MGRRKKVKPEEVPTETEMSIGTPIDLSSFSAPAVEETPITESIKGDESKPLISTEESEPGKTRKPYKKREKESSDEPLIDGEMMVEFIDIIIPAMIAMAHNMFSKDKNISPDQLDLTEKQKAKMMKLANKCAERINLNVNPFLGLGVLIVGNYGMKYMEAKNK